MEHVEIYRDRHFWAWTERDGIRWKGCLAIDNGTMETGLGIEHTDEAQVLQAAIAVARERLEALQGQATHGPPP